jgi:flavin-dependent dehydrogenase
MELFKKFLHNERAKEFLHCASMIPGSMRVGIILLSSTPGPRAVGNVILVGDAGAMADSLTGEGVFQALRSGELAAGCIPPYTERRPQQA